MLLNKQILFLKNYKFNSLEDYKKSTFQNDLIELKKEFLDNDNQEMAKLTWCIETMYNIQYLYIQVWDELKKKNFYEAWCKLEKCEIALKNLQKHKTHLFEQLGFSEIFSLVLKLQNLYPYKLFMSPEILEKKVRCNICNSIVSMRNHCGHLIGEIYNGELCVRIVEDMEFLGVAMVEEPVQKYSVPFMTDEETGTQIDQYNYQLIKYLLEHYNDDIYGWDVHYTTKKYSIDYFKRTERNDKCPCESGKKFKNCCLPKKVVDMPHVEFIFKNFDSKKAYEMLQVNGEVYKNI